jgi:hypothetical protein
MSAKTPTHDEIRIRAYQFWEGRGSPWGTPETDWFRAERELAHPETEFTHVAREVGALVGSAVAILTDLTSGLSE